MIFRTDKLGKKKQSTYLNSPYNIKGILYYRMPFDFFTFSFDYQKSLSSGFFDRAQLSPSG